jgi:hypothetical protein
MQHLMQGVTRELSSPGFTSKAWGDFYEVVPSIKYIYARIVNTSINSWHFSLIYSGGFGQTTLEW